MIGGFFVPGLPVRTAVFKVMETCTGTFVRRDNSAGVLQERLSAVREREKGIIYLKGQKCIRGAKSKVREKVL